VAVAVAAAVASGLRGSDPAGKPGAAALDGAVLARGCFGNRVKNDASARAIRKGCVVRLRLIAQPLTKPGNASVLADAVARNHGGVDFKSRSRFYFLLLQGKKVIFGYTSKTIFTPRCP